MVTGVVQVNSVSLTPAMHPNTSIPVFQLFKDKCFYNGVPQLQYDSTFDVVVMVKIAFSHCSHIGRTQRITQNARLSYLTSPEISHSGLIFDETLRSDASSLIWRLKNYIDWPNGDTVFKGHIFKLKNHIVVATAALPVEQSSEREAQWQDCWFLIVIQSWLSL